MSFYGVLCLMIRNGIPYSISFDGVDDVIEITIMESSKKFTSYNFNEASAWMWEIYTKMKGGAGNAPIS